MKSNELKQHLGALGTRSPGFGENDQSPVDHISQKFRPSTWICAWWARTRLIPRGRRSAASFSFSRHHWVSTGPELSRPTGVACRGEMSATSERALGARYVRGAEQGIACPVA